MLSQARLDRIASATVTLTKKGGRGVLVNGNMILTAAHCINYACDGAMALGEYFIEEIETAQGKLKITPLAIEPVSDIAVLGSLDDQVFPREIDQFELFCDKTKPVQLCLARHGLFRPFSVYILNHDGRWVEGKAQICAEGANCVFVESAKKIKGGAFGGPIINRLGELIAIISQFSEGGHECTGSAPIPHLTLPVWICARILRIG